jgi:hypothetical protein
MLFGIGSLEWSASLGSNFISLSSSECKTMWENLLNLPDSHNSLESRRFLHGISLIDMYVGNDGVISWPPTLHANFVG